MPIFPCDSSTQCPPDSAIENFSSEADDTLDYISTHYAYYPPPLIRFWNQTECGKTYISNISQADADLQAAAASLNCTPCVGPECEGQTTTPGTTYCNTAQQSCIACPDGSQSCYVVPAGMFCGFLTLAEANSVALAWGQKIAKNNAVCVSAISQCTCAGTPYTQTITSSQAATWSTVGLPIGFTLTPSAAGTSAVISGTPVIPGQYTFQVKAVTSVGISTVRTFTITVLKILTVNLPAYKVGSPYSYQLLATGGSGNYAWKITSGSLPNGLTLSPTGLISGTPTS